MSTDRRIHFLIIDDEPIAQRIIEGYAGKLSHLHHVGSCNHPLQALPILRETRVDLIFLDLHMPEMQGFDFLETLIAPPSVIVTTAYEEHALKGYELNVVDYLLKPITEARFIQAVQKVEPVGGPESSRTEEAARTIVVIKGDRAYHRVPLAKIDHVEAFRNACLVHMGSETMLTPRKISDLEQAWKPLGFIRVHKSFLVPLDQIASVAAKTLTVRGREIPIGTAYKREVFKTLGLQ